MSEDLVLTPPAPVAAVPVEKAATMLPLPGERAGELARKAAASPTSSARSTTGRRSSPGR